MADVNSKVALSAEASALKFPTLWTPLDAMQCGSADSASGPLDRAMVAVQSVREALRAGNIFSVDLLTKLLDTASGDLRSVEALADGMVVELGALEGWGNLAE